MILTQNSREVLPSAFNMINSNRSIGYSIEAAVADIIDNSISAQASNIDLLAPPSYDPILYICDNGKGMNQVELDNAMTFGGKNGFLSKRSESDLGRYGLGLKTASLSQCRTLTVITKQQGKILGGCWSLDQIEKTNEWRYLVIPEDECRKILVNTPLHLNNSGTVVVWQDFDRIQAQTSEIQNVFVKMLDSVKKHLELIFHRYLEGEFGLTKLSMSLNGNNLKPNDPFLRGKIPGISEPITIQVKTSSLMVTPHKLLHPNALNHADIEHLTFFGSSFIDTQGFYVYRNKRLIVWGTWFRLAPKLDRTKLCRIQIDLPNSIDHEWSLDIKKSTATPPAAIRRELKSILDHNLELSIQTFSKRVSRRRKDLVPYWNRMSTPNGVKYEVNVEHPQLKCFLNQLSDSQKKSFRGILKDIATFFPVGQMQVDLQKDITIENEIECDMYSDDDISSRALTLLSAGFTLEDLKKTELFSVYPEVLKKLRK
nr:ATP-binding protein [uncultured Sphaerochaeta sp.]